MEYVLRYGQLGSNETTEMYGIDPFKPGAMVDSLVPNSWYQFEVALVNEVGRGPLSSVTGYTGLRNSSWPSKSIVS